MTKGGENDMAFEIVPGTWNNFSRQLSSILDDDNWAMLPNMTQNLSISEDEKNIYVAAAVPGVNPKNVEITFDKGVLWIKASQEEKEEDKKKKFYRKAASSFSYRLAVPGELDQTKEPEANIENGVVLITFAKTPQTEPKKIQVKTK